ncbi:ribosome biogenesis protein BMS1 homolog [Lampris incognitus]|uniref:ribosome biogenesis protein BMS1 homolog n=1 Tax=Lampris incognitus TaxID=2546036 RepID=UPI0024B6119E|nr:ribosome biogenesis protein BMS1 homolog [Lampris incognitus]
MDGKVKEQKPHQQKHSGPKAKRKKMKNQGEVAEMEKHKRNPKAYAVQSAVRMAKTFHRAQDLKARKHHIPVVDRTPLEPPPVVVVVVGPPKVGKSTLIRCLIKNFTRQKLVDICGPVTIVCGKKRRLTFVECSNDINTMIDLAKVADLVLMLIDASFGFEMETFEFLNICQVHGFPRIMGILTHLDSFKNNKSLRKTKKNLKHRFWTEVYQGAKLFYLSGMVYGEYQSQEVKNLGRFISVMKFRPLTWQTSHPYVLADRMEDLTDPEKVRLDPKCDRTVSFYGYLRGTYFKNKGQVHIPGVGDFGVADVSFLQDPCPLPEVQKKRSLNEKERLLYAPMAGVGGVVYDKDAVYIDLPSVHVNKDQEEGNPATELVQSLIETHATLDAKMAASKLSLFTGATTLETTDVEEQEGNNEALKENWVLDPENQRERRKVFFPEEEEKGGNGITSDEDEVKTDTEEESSDEDGEGSVSSLIEEAKAKPKKTETAGRTPLLKKTKRERKGEKELFELPVFADSEDDLEMNEEEQGKKETKHKSRQGQLEQYELASEDDKEVKKPVVERVSRNCLKEDEDVEGMDDEDEVEESEAELMEVHVGTSKTNEKCINNHDREIKGEDLGQFCETEGTLRWKEGLHRKAAEAFLQQKQATPNLRKLVYSRVAEEESDVDDEEELGGLFRVSRPKKSKRYWADATDCSCFKPDGSHNWDLEEMLASIRDCFVTGKWEENKDAYTLLKQEEELYGDFEDLETGEVHRGPKGEQENQAEDNSDEDADEDADKERVITMDDEVQQNKRLEKKRKLKELFNVEYDEGDKPYFDDLKEEMQKQAELNRAEFEDVDDDTRVQYEGFRPGMYVRVEVPSMPCEFVANFDPHFPVILGGLGSSEGNVGYLQMRLKKHRWHDRILKTRDPLILSLGWRRFQTIPLYHIEDHNGRHRLLKYTPQHMHCGASIFGPITPQGSGFLAVQSVTETSKSSFRIAATGVVLEMDKSVRIVKKLKLVGYPYKIYKNTCFINGMFNSVLEVAKFEGASIRTVSGIRGQIKKALATPAGAYRASFEDKLLMSDIVFLRSWYPVSVPQLYNPVTSLLLPDGQKNTWSGMRTLGQLKHDLQIHNKPNTDSLYKPVVRAERRFNPLHIPRQLQKALPFKSKPKQEQPKGKTPSDLQRPAAIREPHERKVAALLNALSTVYHYNSKKASLLQRSKHKDFLQKRQTQEEDKLKRQKEARKKLYRMMGQMEKKKQESSLKGASHKD